MKRNFLGILMLTLLFFMVGCGGTEESQREETIFDGKAETLIGNLKVMAASGNFNLSEPKINNVNNEKYCTVNFGNSEENKLNLKLNADDSVINAEILAHNDYDSGKTAGMLLSGTLLSVGAEQSELEKFLKNYQSMVEEEVRKQNNAATPIIDRDIKIYCGIKKKDFNVNIKSDEKQVKFFVSPAK